MKRLICVLLVCVLCFGLTACGEAAKQEKYDQALAYLDSGLLDNALVNFIELGDYQDSQEMVSKINAYKDAKKLLENKELEDAYLAFKELNGFYDAEEILDNFLFVQTSLDSYENGKNYRSEEYEYNKDGSLSVTLIYELDKNTVNEYYKTYTYNKAKNTCEVETGGSKGATLREKREYDDQGRVIYYMMHALVYNTIQSTYYSYDEAGNQVKAAEYDLDGDLLYTIFMEYDKHNQVVHKYYVKEGKTTSEYFYKNTYDEQGNLIKVVTESGSIFTYEYNADGLMTYEEIDYGNGTKVATKYEYDRYGNCTRKISGDYEHIYKYAIMYIGK